MVFPAHSITYAEQVLSGAFPISQVQEPYTVVGHLASHSNLIEALNLKSLISESQTHVTAWEICEEYAEMKNFRTGKGSGRIDVYRGANQILRLVLMGELSLHTEMDEIPDSGSITALSSYLSFLRKKEIELISEY